MADFTRPPTASPDGRPSEAGPVGGQQLPPLECGLCGKSEASIDPRDREGFALLHQWCAAGEL